MVKVKKVQQQEPPWKEDFLVVSDTEFENIKYEENTLEEARRIVQIMNAPGGEDLSWDEIHETMEREGFYL